MERRREAGDWGVASEKSRSDLVLLSVRWLTQKGVRQKKLNEWLGIKNENTEE